MARSAPTYAYGIPLNKLETVPWRNEYIALRQCYNFNANLLDIPDNHEWLVTGPFTNYSHAENPVLLRTQPDHLWFLHEQNFPITALRPWAACHPDDVRWLRNLTGLSQADFASLWGVDQPALSRYETGRTVVTLSRLNGLRNLVKSLLVGAPQITLPGGAAGHKAPYYGAPSALTPDRRPFLQGVLEKLAADQGDTLDDTDDDDNSDYLD